MLKCFIKFINFNILAPEDSNTQTREHFTHIANVILKTLHCIRSSAGQNVIEIVAWRGVAYPRSISALVND